MNVLSQQIYDHSVKLSKIQFKELEKITKASSRDVASAINVLLLEHLWKTRLENGRLWLYPMCSLDQGTTKIKHREIGVVEIKPKLIPINGDWTVYIKDEDNRPVAHLYFDAEYTRDEVRLAYSKLQKCKIQGTGVHKYHKIAPLRQMHNF